MRIATFTIVLFLIVTAASAQSSFQGSNGKYGYKDQSGKEIIAPVYERAKGFSDGLAAVKQNGKWGYIDITGKVVVPMKYDIADFFNEGLAAVMQNGKLGFISKTGDIAIPFMYEDGAGFENGVAQVVLNGKTIKIDKNGKEVTGTNAVSVKQEAQPLNITTSFGLSWTMPDEEYKIDKSDYETIYHYVTPLKDAEVFIKILDTKQSTSAFNTSNKLVSERTNDLKTDGFSVNGVDVKSYLTNINTSNFIHGLLATAGSSENQASILYFYFHEKQYVVSIHVLYPQDKNVNAITKKDIKQFLASFKTGS